MKTTTVSPRMATADPMTPAQFARFRDLIEERCGLHLDETHQASLAASLRVRMNHLDLARVDDYHRHLCGQPAGEEFGKLINLVTVTETCFFRDPSQFRMLRSHILPAILAERVVSKKAPLRIWSAGCSSGEEAYSIALTLWDMGLYHTHPEGTFEIVATDVNTEALDAAKRGVYSARALRHVESDCIGRHFRRVGPDFHLHDGIKRRVRFEYGNLAQTPLTRSSPGFDLVVCKNVAIYFRPERTRRLVRGFHAAVNDGGFLLLGHSESLWQLADDFALVEYEGAFGYRKGGPKPAAAPHKARRLQPRARIERATRDPLPVPEAADGQYERCLEAFRAEAWEQAEASLAALIASSPQFVPAYLLLGGVYAHRGRWVEAREQAQRVLRLNDLEPRGHLLQGMMAARSGRVDEARAALRRALYLNDSLVLAHFWLGNLYRDAGDNDRACLEYRKVVRDWERHTFEFTDEFASDLNPEQIVDFCRRRLPDPDAGPIIAP